MADARSQVQLRMTRDPQRRDLAVFRLHLPQPGIAARSTATSPRQREHQAQHVPEQGQRTVVGTHGGFTLPATSKAALDTYPVTRQELFRRVNFRQVLLGLRDDYPPRFMTEVDAQLKRQTSVSISRW